MIVFALVLHKAVSFSRARGITTAPWVSGGFFTFAIGGASATLAWAVAQDKTATHD